MQTNEFGEILKYNIGIESEFSNILHVGYAPNMREARALAKKELLVAMQENKKDRNGYTYDSFYIHNLEKKTGLFSKRYKLTKKGDKLIST